MAFLNTLKAADNRDHDFSWSSIVWVWGLVIVAWGVVLFAFAMGLAPLVDHDYLLVSGHLPWGVALAIFLLTWQVMLVAMMLPSLLSPLALVASAHRSRKFLRQIMFLVGYAAVWTLFAAAAFLADTLLHRLVVNWWWLYTHSRSIGFALLALAGGYQLCSLKHSYLQRCCVQDGLCLPEYQDEVKASWLLGLRHGKVCLGSCWAIMLVMIGIGMKSLLGMALLSGVMFVEREFSGGNRLRVGIGCAFLVLSVLWLALPL